MLIRFNDWNRTFTAMADLHRRMDRLFGEDYEDGGGAARGRGGLFDDFGEQFGLGATASWPRVNLFDTQAALVLLAEIPGLTEKDVHISVNEDVLSVRGERRSDAPNGFTAHRSERTPLKFSRSLKLPCRVDLEKTSATVKNGILTISLLKAPEAQPKQINVRAQ